MKIKEIFWWLSAATIIIFLCLLLTRYADVKTCYTVEVEFTDGSKRTVQFESIERPKVTDEGCMYDHSKKSWICGCRDIQYKDYDK